MKDYMSKDGSYVQIKNQDGRLGGSWLDRCRKDMTWEELSHKTGIDLRTVMKIANGKKILPLSDDKIRYIMDVTECSEVSEEQANAIYGKLPEHYVKAVRNKMLAGADDKKVIDYSKEASEKEKDAERYMSFLHYLSIFMEELSADLQVMLKKGVYHFYKLKGSLTFVRHYCRMKRNIDPQEKFLASDGKDISELPEEVKGVYCYEMVMADLMSHPYVEKEENK